MNIRKYTYNLAIVRIYYIIRKMQTLKHTHLQFSTKSARLPTAALVMLCFTRCASKTDWYVTPQDMFWMGCTVVSGNQEAKRRPRFCVSARSPTYVRIAFADRRDIALKCWGGQSAQ